MRRNLQLLIVMVLACGLSVLVLRPAIAVTYTITDLGTLSSGDSFATDINYRGQIVGNSTSVSGKDHAFLYENGLWTDLGTLYGTTSSAHGINDKGQIVGYSGAYSGDVHAFLYENGTMTDIGDLGGDSYGFDINNKSQVVGFSFVVSFTNDQHAFIYENGQMTDIGAPPLGEFSFAHGINDNGQIVGDAQFKSRHAFLYDNGSWTDLGTLGGNSSTAWAINNSGQIVGNARTNTNADNAFLYENGQMTDLGTLGGGQSVAYDINNYGQIVGYAATTSGDIHAFLYENGGMIDLGTLPGGTISQAFGINDKGQIVGYAFTVAGNCHAVLWTQVPVPITIDIKPKRCPNKLNVKSKKHKGKLRIAILGTADLDVTIIDIDTIRLNGVVSPIKSKFKNVAAPPNTCDCSTVSADAIVDLVLIFKKQEIIEILGVVSNGEEVPIVITGKLLDGTPIEGTDCVVIKGVK